MIIMKRNCSNKYNSKGVMALEALLGTILSVVALVMIFYVFSNAFLQTNDNHKIAEQNAKSMKEFIDYFSQGEFKDYSNCYGMLKLENLENFQGPDKDNVYKYIIKKDGIYLINKNIINAIDGGSKKNKYIIDLKKPQVKFENEIEIYLDETDSGSIFSAYGSGSYDEKIKLSKKLNYVILEPDYGFFDKSSVGYNQNKYIITYFKDVARNEYDINSVVEDNMYGELGGRYLAYNNNRNILFIVNEEISETLLFYDLCSLKQLNENTRHFFYEKRNGRNLDYINNIIIYRFKKDDGNYHDISYK
ncbi:MAG: hypothetical protein KC589_00640, partial [Nanoarchaeota archaeon]|nr:hypothetical protein [Nanoarchaeota archaeon]